MTEPDLPNSDIDGRLVKRFKYPDGRLTALIAVDNDWQVVVFATEDAADAFAQHFKLRVTELEHDDNGG